MTFVKYHVSGRKPTLFPHKGTTKWKESLDRMSAISMSISAYFDLFLILSW